MSLDDLFPRLRVTGFRETSPPNEEYNCIAWAAGHTDNWWEPVCAPTGAMYYWPEGAPYEYSVAAYIQAFETLGYTPSEDASIEPGFEKVAIYALNDEPKHAARQLPIGRWTSKLGKHFDIEHDLDGLVGPFYGQVVQILRRRVTRD